MVASWEGHLPVMIQEVITYLKCNSAGIYVDATLGGGGHAQAILEATNPEGKLLGIDQDKQALAFAKTRLALFEKRVKLRGGRFSNIALYMKQEGFNLADGILADLGVSSHQLQSLERGFSFQKDAPLDMRMDPDSKLSAIEVVNQLAEKDLANLIYEYGEERGSRRIAKQIVMSRKLKSIQTTQDLAKIVIEALPGKMRQKQKIHPATKTFQAIRIYVNQELQELESFLQVAPELLKPGGRLVIISYHSLEDRLVKRRFQAAKKEGYKVITKKIIIPSSQEVAKNPRARSAKMRVLERL
ncbi:MAG: 16S rRNA (cytosine(1402)-N(4))-methyltransferase RsmH [Pseudomonadota bacterium]